MKTQCGLSLLICRYHTTREARSADGSRRKASIRTKEGERQDT